MTTDDLPVWRTKKYADLTLAGVTGDGVFSGYASLFGEVDLGKDAIAPGAFVRCAITGKPIPIDELMYWNVDRQEPYVDAVAAHEAYVRYGLGRA